MEIKVLESVLRVNEELAKSNKNFFKKKDIFAINIMSSPGAGKTSLVVESLKRIKEEIKSAVIVGDYTGKIDAERIGKLEIPTLQLETASCHLDANMLSQALKNMDLENINLLFIENVGNLICPAEYKLGVNKNIVILSTPEGSDKPFKYPLMFSISDVLIINKIDLIQSVDFNIEKVKSTVLKLNPKIKIFTMSCKTSEGIDNWTNWIKSELKM
ncbi:unnamed protein product [marine sediment metagenome]|uniref:CobW/HypB/UreG nucleotide-binding domain-containing protein n=4 Tax=marine sediment metagenome TaxID=412755 RepID=X1A356_9ZZZZ